MSTCTTPDCGRPLDAERIADGHVVTIDLTHVIALGVRSLRLTLAIGHTREGVELTLEQTYGPLPYTLPDMLQHQPPPRRQTPRLLRPLPRLHRSTLMKQPPTEDPQKTREQLGAEIREGRETLKDLRHEIKTARELMEATRQFVTRLAQEEVKAVVEAEVTKQVTALREETNEVMRKSTAKVIAEFDKLRDLLLGHERVADGREDRSIPELLQDPAILAHAQRAARRNNTDTGSGRG